MTLSMKMLSRGAIVALGMATIATATALAADATVPAKTFEVEFNFTRTAPVATTYAEFERVARNACRGNQRTGVLRSYLAAERCETELLDKAVRETGLPSLIDYHTSLTGSAPRMNLASSQ